MQGGHQQQAYDRGVTVFSPDGRLYQVEYAREAVKRGTAAVGVKTDDGVVLAVDKRTRSELMEESSVEKLHKIDDHVGVGSAGHVADARRLVDYARRVAQGEQLRYGEPGDVEALTKAITDHVQETTQVGGSRPYGAALLVAGVDEDGTPRLFEADPSGTPVAWQAVAVGGGRSDAEDVLEAEYDQEASLDDGVELALDALAATLDGDEEPEPADVGVATVDAADRTYRALPDDEVADFL